MREIPGLRHPLERRVATLVSVIDAVLMAAILGILFLGAEWLEARGALFGYAGQYVGHAKLLLALVLGAPILATFIRRRRRLIAQEESIRINETQLPDVYAVLVKHCRRVGVPVPELYLSDGIPHTTSFSWRGRHCIILSTHDFSVFPDAFDDVVDFVLAREVGSICLGYTAYRNELLASSVKPIPFLSSPLNHVRTYSRDRYGAFLAPHSFRALVVAASGDPLCKRISLESYLAQLDEELESAGVMASVMWLFSKRVPLARRVQELRRAGMLKAA